MPDPGTLGERQNLAVRPRALIAAPLLGLTLFGLTATGWFLLPRSAAVSNTILLALWLNIAFLLVAITVEASRRPYSLHLMKLVSLFLFLGAASLFQYSVGMFGVAGSIEAMHRNLPLSIASVSLWILVYIGAYEAQRLLGGRRKGSLARFLSRPLRPWRVSLVLALALLSLAYLGVIGLSGAATRANVQDAIGDYVLESGAGGYGVAFYLIHYVMLRAFSLVALLAGLVLIARDLRSRQPLLLLLVLGVGVGTLLVNNPFAAARMWLATAAIGFVAPFMLRRRRSGWGLVLIALGGIAFLPALHESRYSESFDEWVDYFALASPLDYLSTNSDVDSLGMLSLCQRWTETHGYRWGLQTLGSLLFWFPRSLWPTKPIETGAMVTEDLGFDFTNLAPPIMSDPLVDFGLIGIPVFAGLFGILFARIDRTYWEGSIEGDRRARVIDCIYPFWLGCVIFLTRGGSFASFSFTIAFTVWMLPLVLGVRAEEPIPVFQPKEQHGGPVTRALPFPSGPHGVRPKPPSGG